MRLKTLCVLASGLALLVAQTALPMQATAAIVEYTTPAGTLVGGQPVDAKATFVTGAGSLSITLENLKDNPTSVIQALSDLAFALSGHETTGTLSSSSGLERTVNSNKTYTDGAVGSTGWALQNAYDFLPAAGADGLRVHVLGTLIGPAHLVVGGPDGASNKYDNANGSIKGNPGHNPFLAGAITFTLAIPGVTADATVTDALFSFGTSEGNNVPGCRKGDCVVPPIEVATPGALALLGTGLAAVGLGGRVLGRRRSR